MCHADDHYLNLFLYSDMVCALMSLIWGNDIIHIHDLLVHSQFFNVLCNSITAGVLSAVFFTGGGCLL